MHITRVVALATLTLTGLATAQAAEVIPAWRSDGFIMEEIVVTAKAPDHRFIKEIVVTATAPQLETTIAALESPDGDVTPVPVIGVFAPLAPKSQASPSSARRMT